MRARRLRVLWAVAVVVFAAATYGLYVVSRGKWSDAIIDSGREWIVPAALAQGELLYRDVVYWFGPFTPYFHAAFFRVFGSSFSTLVAAGVVGSVGVLAALFAALRTVTARREAVLWTALAVPALVFMPNAGGSILGMGYRMWHAAAFALAAVAILIRPPESERWWCVPLAGALAALAGLCRTEWGLAALAAAGFVVLHREADRRRVWPKELRLVGAFLLVFAGAYVFFGITAGWNSFTRDAPVLLVNLPAETRSQVVLSGLSAWRSGIWTLLYSSAMWLGVFFLVEIAALRRVDIVRARRRLFRLAVLLVLLALVAWRGGGFSGGLIWSAAPFVCATACVVGLRWGRQPVATALTGFGTLGLLLAHRRLFFIEDAPYVGPPLLFAFVCAAGLCSMTVAHEMDGPMQERLRVGVAVVLVLLTGVAFASRLLEYGKDDRVPIAGTAGCLSARAEVAREIENLGTAIRAGSRKEEGLVVFPEGEILNFLSGRKNPVRHKLYLPGYVNDRNEGEILRELQMTSPATVVIWRRPLGEYGRGLFGEGYGQRTRGWIEEHYVQRPVAAAGAQVYTIAGRPGS